LRIGDFYQLLNRRDIFADFSSKSSIGVQWGGSKDEGIGMWNVLWQIILAKELALRLGNFPDASMIGFTHRVLASLIVQDLWLSNIEIILTAKILPDDIKKPVTLEEQAKAEEFKSKGNEAWKKKQCQNAVDLYTEAIKADLSNAVYRSNRSAALTSMKKYEEARQDAYIATQLDPNYAKAWFRLGLAEKKLGNRKRARDAYERAVKVAGKDATSLMKQELADAKAKIKDDLEAIDKETDMAVKDLLRKDYLDEDWDIAFMVPELHSHVHEQQVEGLLHFAERIKWPYINEARNYAEDVYGNLRSGQVIEFHLHDWLYGMTLPGKWMSHKVMAALVLCTPSISKSLGVAHYYDCGLSLPKQSYWRARTVLGRVLGCLPGVVSLCGWIGPCPSLEFIPPLPEGATKELRYIRLKTRRVAPDYTPDSDNNVIHLSHRHNQYEATRLQPDEDLPAYLAEMKDADKWVIPEPPVRELSTCTIQSIRLKKLPPDINVTAQKARKEISDQEVDSMAEYRASIVFTIDNNEDAITYTLYTNPVFVTPPPCRPGPQGIHEVHLRALPMYQKNVWTVDRLKDHTPEDFDDNVMVINATGKGAEALARAWCSERGKNAVIRRSVGPCFVCALGAASKAGLGTGILIWVS
jgi:tetratricopeptide (TPR) repeat protein